MLVNCPLDVLLQLFLRCDVIDVVRLEAVCLAFDVAAGRALIHNHENRRVQHFEMRLQDAATGSSACVVLAAHAHQTSLQMLE